MKVIDHTEDLNKDRQKINKIAQQEEALRKDMLEDSLKIKELQDEVKKLAHNAKIDVPIESIGRNELASLENQVFLNWDLYSLEKRIKDEVMQNPEILPKLNKVDWIIVGIAGAIAALLDILAVRIPKDINYMRQYDQRGSGFTQWLRTLGIDDEGKLNLFLSWCEDACKVPYDKPAIKGTGVYPRNHRLRSLAHDPLFGLIFGIFDIFNGSITYFDKQGHLQILKTLSSSTGDKLLAPLLWLGHLVSDVCTKQGLPIPGWGFLQLLQFGSFGSKDRTIAQISEWMYLNGYDLRHLMTMAIVPASVEVIVRGYHGISLLNDENSLFNPAETIAEKEITIIKGNLKLHKMLCLAHGIAASGNAFKVWTYQGNPTAINITQWMMFVKESINMLTAVTRETTTEKVISNRAKINLTWEELTNIKIGKDLNNLEY